MSMWLSVLIRASFLLHYSQTLLVCSRHAETTQTKFAPVAVLFVGSSDVLHDSRDRGFKYPPFVMLHRWRGGVFRGMKMKLYVIKFMDGHSLELYASSAHNAEQMAIGICSRSSGKPQNYVAAQIVSVELRQPSTHSEVVNQNAQHMPGPWRVGQKYPCRIFTDRASVSDRQPVASTCEREDEGTETDQQKIDAAFIVRACNSHDELLEALTNVLCAEFGSIENANYWASKNNQPNQMWKRALSTLAKAQGGDK